MSIEVEGFFFFFLFGCLLAKVADHFLHVCIILGWDEGLFFFFSFFVLEHVYFGQHNWITH